MTLDEYAGLKIQQKPVERSSGDRWLRTHPPLSPRGSPEHTSAKQQFTHGPRTRSNITKRKQVMQ
jgi:hypothetical protein